MKQLPLTDDFLVARHGGDPHSAWLASLFESSNLATTAAIGGSGGMSGRAIRALEASHFDLLRRRLGRHVIVERTRLGLLDVLVDRNTNDHVLIPSEAAADTNAVAFRIDR